ncbi:MAG: glycosyltransferase family 9 protein [Acidobacteriota bacterium]
MIIHTDCKYFKGSIPCRPHKEKGVHCDGCPDYAPISERILIIKLGAAGDVIRTTPLLRRIHELMPGAHITWLTDFPDLVPRGFVDEIVKYSPKDLVWLVNREFDLVYSLDKDKEAIAVAEQVRSAKKFGFGMDRFGRCRAFNECAEAKFLTGLFDDVSRANTKSYPEEIFEMCGFVYAKEPYILERRVRKAWNIPHEQKLIGCNTGCGGRWPSRLWPDEFWIEFARTAKSRGYEILWLGGEQEHEKNLRLSQIAGGIYAGHFSLAEFISLMDECDLVVSQVTMAMHIALGLGKKLVLMNNIFNPNEFELYGLGEIVEPPVPCGCYFTPTCPHDSMRNITPQMVMDAVGRQMQP